VTSNFLTCCDTVTTTFNVHKIDFHRRHVYARLTGQSRRTAVLNLRRDMKLLPFRFVKFYTYD